MEVLLLQNPYQLKPGDRLEAQVLFDGQPLENHLVTAFHGDGKRLISTAKARTDAQGIARFTLTQAGFWLIRLVHLLPCSDPDVDWESHWASYSFMLHSE